MSYSPLKWLLILGVIEIFVLISCQPLLASSSGAEGISLCRKLAHLEEMNNGRIGLSVVDAAGKRRFQYHSSERFPLCSTAKLMAVAAILKRNMADNSVLKQKIIYGQEDLVTYSPVTEKHLTEGMTICDLCEAAITKSDNTAMNLLIRKLGGTEKVTLFSRSMGDRQFRLDRIEPELNSACPGDLRDTSTPEAMGKSLYRLALGNVLASPERHKLQDWFKRNTTGGTRIRAGVPSGWIVGDKTGTGDYGTTNDIAIIWPLKHSPIVVAIYFTQNQKGAVPRNDILESVTRMLLKTLKFEDEV